MESDNSAAGHDPQASDNQSTPEEAYGALRDSDRVRNALAARATAPWWYHLGAALLLVAVFVGIGLSFSGTESLGLALFLLGAIIGPAALIAALRSATSVALDRYSQGMFVWTAVIFGLLLIGFALQVWAEVPYAIAALGIAAGVVTLWRERRIDKLVRARIGSDGSVA